MKKGNNLRIYLFAAAGILFLLAVGCKKETEPVLTTTPVTYISEQSVTCSGNVTEDGGAEITDRGICWGVTPNPTNANGMISGGSGLGSYTCTLDGLNTNTQYYIRAYAVNKAGTGYGPQITFRTWNSDMATDIDGNQYHTVTIGTQVWLVENLKVTHYRNGDVVPEVTDNGEWEGLTSGARCNYNNNTSNVPLYGILYNWFAINDPRNIAPEGWHVASDAEWVVLANFLGGEETCGGKLKEAGLIHWNTPNDGATNESGFSGLPGGHRTYGGVYDYILWGGGWWSTTEGNPNDAWTCYLDCGNDDLWRYLDDKRYGRSVKCLKD